MALPDNGRTGHSRSSGRRATPGPVGPPWGATPARAPPGTGPASARAVRRPRPRHRLGTAAPAASPEPAGPAAPPRSPSPAAPLGRSPVPQPQEQNHDNKLKTKPAATRQKLKSHRYEQLSNKLCSSTSRQGKEKHEPALMRNATARHALSDNQPDPSGDLLLPADSPHFLYWP
ncbi:uncharacterized protein LOC133275249 [Pezoporus flaviventris]|uniref:uncharacterized protein LOC133275249 n=1 Tax=Pezoporus flaviventris TaxID=889875 RepID=UPI002AB25B8D|nr:uncharacterized protein LOC133275249 [Pezoporus flaviventris]